jgi:hypothetical protein
VISYFIVNDLPKNKLVNSFILVFPVVEKPKSFFSARHRQNVYFQNLMEDTQEIQDRQPTLVVWVAKETRDKIWNKSTKSWKHTPFKYSNIVEQTVCTFKDCNEYTEWYKPWKFLDYHVTGNYDDLVFTKFVQTHDEIIRSFSDRYRAETLEQLRQIKKDLKQAQVGTHYKFTNTLAFRLLGVLVTNDVWKSSIAQKKINREEKQKKRDEEKIQRKIQEQLASEQNRKARQNAMEMAVEQSLQDGSIAAIFKESPEKSYSLNCAVLNKISPPRPDRVVPFPTNPINQSEDDIAELFLTPTEDCMELWRLRKIRESYQDTFEGKLSGLLLLLVNTQPYIGDEDVDNMISITKRKSESVCPPLFQIMALKNGTYLVQELQEDTHQQTLNIVLHKNELYQVKDLIRAGVEMIFLYGPYQLVAYQF